MSGRAQRIAFVGAVVAGHETQFKNVCQVASGAPGIDPVVIAVRPDRPHDFIDRYLPLLPASSRGTLRTVLDTAPLFTSGRLEGLWSQAGLPLLPWLYSLGWIRPIPTMYVADSTPKLLREFGPHYGYWGGRSRIKHGLRDALHRLIARRADVVNAWSRWAARSLQDDYGVPASRLRVLPPGVDTSFWHPVPQPQPTRQAPMRLLFVGGDFVRKGGDLLVSVYRTQLRGLVEIDVVTRAGNAEEEPGVRYHTGIRPNDPRLRELYQQADLFVLPTRADCFSMAGVEALASGLPLVMSPVGGIAELFESGREGFFVPPDDGRALTEVITGLASDPVRRREMGRRARALAVSRYDAETNTARMLSILQALINQKSAPR